MELFIKSGLFFGICHFMRLIMDISRDIFLKTDENYLISNDLRNRPNPGSKIMYLKAGVTLLVVYSSMPAGP